MRLLVLYYSSYGHTLELAKEIAQGAREAGADVDLKRVPELIPREIIESSPGLKHGAAIQSDIPIAKVEELGDYDAIIFGSPTRFGNMASQMKNFIDQTGYLWATGRLVNKVAGFFTSVATPHGGHESTLITMMIPMMHHGMIIVPPGYTSPEINTHMGGGTPYGPSTLADVDGSRQPDETERKIARDYGKRIAEIASKLAR
ncbi:MAG: NAD(P)H:quinone oxidoreductase [Candidatus Thorarchaeota archaeon]